MLSFRLPLAGALLAACLTAQSLPARASEIDYKKLYAQTAPAVVLVLATDGQGTASIGTGSIIRADGLVVTNAHVILNHETKAPWSQIFIFLKPEHVTGDSHNDLKNGFEAQWLVENPELDLALLRIVHPPAALPVLPISDDSGIGVGESTAAIGHPEEGARWSLTTGRIGGEWADFDGVKGKDVYQMETSVNRGNSGGPLLDGNGNMIGINTCIARRAPDGLAITGINFAIKSSVVLRWLTANSDRLAVPTDAPTDPPPAPQVVVEATPAPEAQETVPPADTPAHEPVDTIAYTVKTGRKAPRGAVKVPVRVAPAPKAKAGFTSQVAPGKILSPADLTRKYAKEGFDDLDGESAKRGGR